MPRIALVFEYGTLNGGEHSMLAVLDCLSAGDFEFIALAPVGGRLEQALKSRGLRHIPLELRDSAGRRLPRDEITTRLIDAMGKADADLVHANSLSMGRLTGAVADKLSIPTVTHLRDIIKLSAQAIADLNRNRLLIAVSEATRRFHIDQGLNSNRVRVIHNGVDCQRFSPRESAGDLRQELNLPDNSFLFATIGQIGLRKAQDVLAQAAGLAASKLPRAYWLIIGERNSQKIESIEFEQSLIERFAEVGLQDRLLRLGYRDDIPQLLAEIDVLVHPAHQEPFGRVLLEAGATGTPIIATLVGGTEEILANNQTARLIPAGDAHALAGAMLELYDSEPLRQQFSKNVREEITRRFPIDLAAENLRSLWQDVLGI